MHRLQLRFRSSTHGTARAAMQAAMGLFVKSSRNSCPALHGPTGPVRAPSRPCRDAAAGRAGGGPMRSCESLSRSWSCVEAVREQEGV